MPPWAPREPSSPYCSPRSCISRGSGWSFCRFPVPIPAPLFAVAYLAFSYYSSGRSQDRINHDAHIFGALTGLAFVLVTAPERFRDLLRWF